MKFLRPHLYLDPIPATAEFELTVLLNVDDNLKLASMPKITYNCKIGTGPYKGKKETLIQLFFKNKVGLIHPKPMEFNFRLDSSGMDKDEIRVRVLAKHLDDTFQDHDGSSSAHYGDPK